MRFKLNIISTIEPDSYASATHQRNTILLREKIKTLPSNFQFYSNIPNAQVIKLLKKSHIALLPTYADTYGYFSLEAQACGCPVITTNVEAMPEINNDECGWVISIELDDLKNAILRTEKDRSKASETIEKNLYQILISIFNNPETILPKANESLNRIRKFHDPSNHARQLMNIYSSAVHLNQ
jgi:glycosyltransferase involved in cell wall biosynthesis